MTEESLSKVSKLPRFDISNELYREYLYPNGKVLRVDGAKILLLEKRADGDRHRLIVRDADNNEYGMYITPGWLAIRWTTPDNKHGIVL